jgi:hypothetical protein
MPNAVHTWALSALLVVVAGCATTYTEEQRATSFVQEAADSLARGGVSDAGKKLDIALDWQTGPQQIGAYFDKQPSASGAYVSYLQTEIANATTAPVAQKRRTTLDILRANKVLPTSVLDTLDRQFESVVADAHRRGTLEVTLADPLASLPALSSPEQQRIILTRTIASIRQNQHLIKRPIEELAAYYQRDDVSAENKALIRDALPSLNLKRDELKHIEGAVPSFAASRRDELTIVATLQVKGADRLFKDDLEAELRRPGVQWTASSQASGATIVVERLRHSEAALQDGTETIRYADYQVDALKAGLFMPRNASYIYEVITSGAAIEYGYVVTASTDGKQTYEEVVRGDERLESKRCQNARVQNAFGGTKPAGFVANDDMALRCAGDNVDAIGTARSRVNRAIAAAIFRVPQIKKVVDAQ